MSDTVNKGVTDLMILWEFLTVGDVADWLKIPRRKVLTFIEQEIFSSRATKPGTGHSRKFSLTDLVLFSLFNKLDRLGIKPRHLRSVSEEIANIVRYGAGEFGTRPLIYIKEGEAPDTLDAGIFHNAGQIEAGAVLINLGEVEGKIISIFCERAPGTKKAGQLLSLIGRVSMGEALEQVLSGGLKTETEMVPIE